MHLTMGMSCVKYVLVWNHVILSMSPIFRAPNCHSCKHTKGTNIRIAAENSRQCQRRHQRERSSLCCKNIPHNTDLPAVIIFTRASFATSGPQFQHTLHPTQFHSCMRNEGAGKWFDFKHRGTVKKASRRSRNPCCRNTLQTPPSRLTCQGQT
jgi:hypothetical protein